MNEPKVIVLDIDGTLFDDEKKIQPKTKEFLIKAQERGNVVVLASGRPASGLWYIAEELKMSEHHGLYVVLMVVRLLTAQQQISSIIHQ